MMQTKKCWIALAKNYSMVFQVNKWTILVKRIKRTKVSLRLMTNKLKHLWLPKTQPKLKHKTLRKIPIKFKKL